jgi:quinolinate synthase
MNMATALAYEQFDSIPEGDCDARIREAKARLGKRLVILGHHYQRDEVYHHADFTGDSLKLSRLAASSDADYIVFCGVHFMAEVADILSRPEQVSILPDLSAGCSLADMADYAAVQRAWKELGALFDPDQRVTPVTYINSSADLKAFCGNHGGLVCTSSNAARVLEWAYQQREKVLFFPDQHLGRNTAYRMNIPLEDMAEWDFNQPRGGLTREQIEKAKILLWKGFCSVHQMFMPQHVDAFRKAHPEGKVISHPECSFEVCQKSDYVGSTEFIIKTIEQSAPGSRWLVGTELNLVNRLAEQGRAQNKIVEFMSPTVCMCSTMFRIDPQHLLWTLENLVAGRVANQIKVAPAEAARLALNRMLDVSP